MNQVWIMYGLYAWIMYGFCVNYVQTMYGFAWIMCMGDVWIMEVQIMYGIRVYGVCMDCVWIKHGLCMYVYMYVCMEYVWIMTGHGLCMDYVCMKRVWIMWMMYAQIVYGLCMDYARVMYGLWRYGLCMEYVCMNYV